MPVNPWPLGVSNPNPSTQCTREGESRVSATVLTREKEWRHKFILKNCMKCFNWKRACIFTYIHLFIFCIPTSSNTCLCRVKALIGVMTQFPQSSEHLSHKSHYNHSVFGYLFLLSIKWIVSSQLTLKTMKWNSPKNLNLFSQK